MVALGSGIIIISCGCVAYHSMKSPSRNSSLRQIQARSSRHEEDTEGTELRPVVIFGTLVEMIASLQRKGLIESPISKARPCLYRLPEIQLWPWRRSQRPPRVSLNPNLQLKSQVEVRLQTNVTKAAAASTGASAASLLLPPPPRLLSMPSTLQKWRQPCEQRMYLNEENGARNGISIFFGFITYSRRSIRGIVLQVHGAQ